MVVADKIRRLLPDTRPILRGEILRTYDSLFDWRKGLLLVVFAGKVGQCRANRIGPLPARGAAFPDRSANRIRPRPWSRPGTGPRWAQTCIMLEEAGSVCEAGDYRVRKSVEGLTFEIAINRNPPGLGKNAIRINGCRRRMSFPLPGVLYLND